MGADGKPGLPPTLEEVAAAAGVSRATVSRVVNGSPKVSDRVRAQVEQAISRLGYVPNRAARSLATGRSGSVALVVHEPGSRVFAEPFFAGIIRGTGQALAEADLAMMVLFASSDEECERIVRFLTHGHADGALLISLHGADPLPHALARARFPLVLLGRPLDGLDVAYVDADNRGGAVLATRHLIERGRRRIATITGTVDMAVGQDRFDGYLAALNAAGIPDRPELVAHGDFSQASGDRAMRELLAAAPDLDAVFAASDLMALGAIQALQEAGRRIPDDVAVIGFEDSPAAARSVPPLSSVHQPLEEFAPEMVGLLLSQLAGDRSAGPATVLLPTSLIARETT